MLAQLNARRAAIGAPPLTLSTSLSDLPENWSDDHGRLRLRKPVHVRLLRHCGVRL